MMLRKLVILIVIITSVTTLKAQDTEPSSLTFTYYVNSHTFTEPFDLEKFPQNEFMLGWQWGGHSFN